MCEFTVYVKTADSEEQEKITQEDRRCNKKGNLLYLMDVMGTSQWY